MRSPRQGNRGGLSRRAFISAGLGSLLSGIVLPGRLSAQVSPREPSDRMQAGVLVDLTRCIGCRACENACLTRRGQPSLRPALAGYGYGQGEDRLTFRTWTFVDSPRFVEGGSERTIPVKVQCLHCNEPACVAACPVAALQKTPRGAVIYRESRCIGCRYCMLACPFNIPRFEWESGLFARVGKCDFCDDRIASGLRPACVAACPTGALKFGRRAEVLDEAHGRMVADPGRYLSVYGDKVVGGTSWIYLSDVPMDRLGFRTDLPGEPLPSLTWKVVSKIPVVIVGVGLILAGGLWVRKAESPDGH